MKYLDDVPAFPQEAARTLNGYGIETVEAFYGRGVQDPDGMSRALQTTPEEVARLLKLAEGHLDAGFIRMAKGKPIKHPRGVILPKDGVE